MIAFVLYNELKQYGGNMGFFCIIEGQNGSGKTSLVKNLSSKGYLTLSSPNGTPLAKMIRSACRGTEPWEDIDKRVQFLLFSAARLDEYIRCIHGKSETVVVDRWWTSTYVYQCILQGLSVDFLEFTIHPQEKVDLVILLDADDDILIDRVLKERDNNPDHGKCRWIQERETMVRLMKIYREDLPKYLDFRGIPVEKIDTTKMSPEDVCIMTEEIIKKYGG